MAMTCAECGDSLDLHNDWTLVEVSGWKRRRKGGGLNHLLFGTETGRMMCARCALRHRYLGEQLSFDDALPPGAA